KESLQSHGSLGVSQTAYLRCSDIRIIRFALPMRNKFMCSPACRNNLFHVQLPSVRSRERLTRKKLSSLWLDYRLAFV
ncbi:hypothetical protein, partial [Bifidobacterium longum]|uniref:hypothetical protein n=1 Tax=Bifidobacterium longum TaxID=216816 RepID=UPI00286D7122